MKLDRFDALVWSVLAVLALALAGVILAGDQAGERALSVIYLAPSNGPRELWSKTVDAGQSEQLTSTNGKIWDFTVSPDGSQILYSLMNANEGLDLWVMNRNGTGVRKALDCQYDRCSSAAWSLDRIMIAFNREPAGLGPGQGFGPPRIWLFNIQTGETYPLFADTQKLGYGASWSPDGARLAYVDPQVPGIRIIHMQTGQEIFLPSLMGTVGEWSPDGKRMLFINITQPDTDPHVRVYLADLDSQDISTIQGILSDRSLEFGMPVWSPDGKEMIVGVRGLEKDLGRQIWLMAGDGFSAQEITRDPAYVVNNYRWDPQGKVVVFQRTQLGIANAQPEIMIWLREKNEFILLAEVATSPEWLP